MAAIIPRDKLLRTVKDLKLNETGYISPEGMVVKPSLECFIYKKSILIDPKNECLFTEPLKIKRTKEGLIAFVYETKDLWEIYTPSDDEELEERGMLEEVIGFEEVKLTKEEKLQIQFNEALKSENYMLAKKIKEKLKTTIKAG